MSVRQLCTSIRGYGATAIPDETAGAEIRRNADLFRPTKVQTAQRRIAAGRYDGGDLLDAVLEKILVDVAP